MTNVFFSSSHTQIWRILLMKQKFVVLKIVFRSVSMCAFACVWEREELERESINPAPLSIEDETVLLLHLKTADWVGPSSNQTSCSAAQWACLLCNTAYCICAKTHSPNWLLWIFSQERNFQSQSCHPIFIQSILFVFNKMFSLTFDLSVAYSVTSWQEVKFIPLFSTWVTWWYKLLIVCDSGTAEHCTLPQISTCLRTAGQSIATHISLCQWPFLFQTSFCYQVTHSLHIYFSVPTREYYA